MQTSLTEKQSDTPKSTLIEVRFTSGEVDRQAKQFGKPVEHARLFIGEPIYYGTQVVDHPKGTSLLEPREPVLFWDQSRQLYRRGVREIEKSIVLDKKIHRWEIVPCPAWVNDYLDARKGEIVTPLSSEDAYVALSMDIDRKALDGCELAYHLYMTLQMRDIPGNQAFQKESEIQFLSLARKEMQNNLKKKRGVSYLSELDAEDALTHALVRLVRDLRTATSQMVTQPPKERTHKNDEVSFPAQYPFGRFLDSYQQRIVNFLRSITDTARKKLSRLDDKQRKLYVEFEEDTEEVDDGSRKDPRGAAVHRGGPLAALCLKQGLQDMKKLLPRRLFTMLLQRAELGLTMDEIGLANKVSKVQISKDFKTIRKKVGLRAARSLAGIATVEQYEAMAPKRHQRKKSPNKGKIPPAGSTGDETDPS